MRMYQMCIKLGMLTKYGKFISAKKKLILKVCIWRMFIRHAEDLRSNKSFHVENGAQSYIWVIPCQINKEF